jgi:hypothetical protein
MYEARVLAEFAGRQLRNNLRLVASSGLRATMWAVSTLFAIAFVVLRIFTLRLSHFARGGISLDHQIASLYTAFFLLFFAIPLVATRAAGPQFENVAEALLIGTSKLSVRAVFILLQLRALWLTLARMFIVLIILATSGSANPTELARLSVLGLFAVLVPPAYAFHISVASERRRKILRVCGIALIALAAALAFDKIPHGGVVLLAQARGAWWPDVLLVALAAIGVCVPPVRDPIPEFFAATKTGGIAAQRVANRRARLRVRAPGTGGLSEWVFDLSGAWVILSARLAAFIRVRTPLAFAGGLLAWFAVGIGIGVGLQLLGGPMTDAIAGALAFPVVLISCLFAATIGRGLGREIRNPIWWAGDATLTARLGVDSLASLWRFVVSLAAVAAGYAAFGHLEVALLGFAGITILVWLARCCGYALFAYFPSTIDQRGGLAGLRIFALFVLALPVLAVSVVVLVFGLPPIVQFAFVALTAIAEALVLVTVAARRMDGRYEAYI